MRKPIAKILLLLLVCALLCAMLVACKDKSGGPTDNGDTDYGAIPGDNNINKSVIAEDIANALYNSGNKIASKVSGVRYIKSEFTVYFNTINITTTIECNFNYDRHEDSELMLRAYDNQNASTTFFLYYKDRALYYLFNGEQVKIPDFGSTSDFRLLYTAFENLDLRKYICSEDITTNLENFLSIYAVTKNITSRNVTDTSRNITITDLNFDDYKEDVNRYVSNIAKTFGTRFDALSQKILGFNLSELENVKFNRLTMTKLVAILDKITGEDGSSEELLRSLDITLHDYLSDNINTYTIAVSYETGDGAARITPDKFNDPDTNVYAVSKSGQSLLTGTITFPIMNDNIVYKIVAKTKLNTTDNSKNQVIVRITNETENQDEDYSLSDAMFAAYYKDGVGYIDATGFLEYFLMNSVDYGALNLPTLKFENIDLAVQLDSLIASAFGLLQSDVSFLTEIFNRALQGTGSEATDVLLKKVTSKDGVFTVRFDSELVSAITAGKNDSIVSWAAELLGIEEGIIQQLLGLGLLDDAVLLFSYNTNTGEIILDFYVGDSHICIIKLTAQRIDGSLAMDFPDAADPTYFDDYKELAQMEAVNVSIDASVSLQGATSADLSKFMGLFIGDITGANTKFLLEGTEDALRITGNVWQIGNEIFAYIELTYKGEPLVRVVSDPNDPSYLLVDNYMLADSVIKYRYARADALAALKKLAGNTDIYESEHILEFLSDLATGAAIRISDDYISLTVGPNAKANTDPLYAYLGERGLSADLKLSFSFAPTEYTIDSSEYLLPVFEIGEEADVFQNIFEARWRDSVTVVFGGGQILEMSLVFAGESTEIVSGLNEYHPEAWLFGVKVTYEVYFNDTDNGTKKIISLDRANVALSLDPSMEDPIPSVLKVVYEGPEGRTGYLPFVFEDFPYNNFNIGTLYGGLNRQTYHVTFGKGSIAETTFAIDITVLGRNIVPAFGYTNGSVPVVARITIDPYTYSINKLKDPGYNPIRYSSVNGFVGNIPDTTLQLKFNAIGSTTTYDYLNIDNFDWGFTEQRQRELITFNGGETHLYSKFNKIDIALSVTVLARQIRRLSPDIDNAVQINTEVAGHYTVDAFEPSTYILPTVTDAVNEVRIYFTSGTYRIIGEEPEGFVNTDPLCDGYYNFPLAWTYPAVDTDAMLAEDAVYILGNRTKDRTTSLFGDPIMGYQTVTLIAVRPKRAVSSLADTVVMVTSFGLNSSGEVNQINREAQKVSSASFTENGVLGGYFEYDPYDTSEENCRLPGTIWLSVEYRGVFVRKEYNISWIAEGNIIDSEGYILHPLVNEDYIRVRGVVGEGPYKQTVTLVVHNLDSKYESVIFYGTDGNVFGGVESVESNGDILYYINGLNAYEDIALPSSFLLHFAASSGVPDRTYAASWLTESGEDIEHYIKYTAPTSYYLGGVLTIVSAVRGGGLKLDQQVKIYLTFSTKNVVGDRIYGLSEDFDISTIADYDDHSASGKPIPYYRVNTYAVSSQTLYEKFLLGNLTEVGILFDDATVSNGVSITWQNAEELIARLENPLGSNNYYNNGAYPNDLFILRGTIAAGTLLSQQVTMAFMIEERILTAINFPNYKAEFSAEDEEGIAAVDIEVEMKRVESVIDPGNGATTVTMAGSNRIQIRLNKLYTLKGYYYDEDDNYVYGLCTPSQYIEYLFSRVSLTHTDKLGYYEFNYELPSDFDALCWGNANSSLNDVTFDGNNVIIRFTVSKLSEGSCAQSFAVTVTAVRDFLTENVFPEYVETFNTDGSLKYSGFEGYTLADTFAVEYYAGGTVIYEGLSWYAENRYESIDGSAVIDQGSLVTNVSYKFFSFISGAKIGLFAELPDGRIIRRNITFYQKDIGGTAYNSANAGQFTIRSGVINIENAYDMLSLIPNFASYLPTTIIPYVTTLYARGGEIRFDLVGGWIPTAAFAQSGDPSKFSVQKLTEAITSAGLPATALATGRIMGYNGETQTVTLYLSVDMLSEPKITYSKLNISDNVVTFDPYLNTYYNSVLTLPKDITVSFGDIVYTFTSASAVSYEICEVENLLNTHPITSIPYTKFGHAMGSVYGSPTDTIILKVTLPDGKSVNLRVNFLSRELDSVEYFNGVSGATYTEVQNNGYISGVYYIDPYDRSTYTLPGSAKFIFNDGASSLDLALSLTPYGQAASDFTSSYGRWKYNGGATAYQGGSYLFYGKLSGFYGGDKDQYYILSVIVLNRALNLGASSIPMAYTVDVPFTFLISDITSPLANAVFADLGGSTIRNYYSTADLNSLRTIVGDASYTVVSSLSSGNIYAEFLAIRTPVLPDAQWYITSGGTRRLLTNDDIEISGAFNKPIIGVLGYSTEDGRSAGEEISSSLVCYETWVFEGIDGLEDMIIDFNQYATPVTSVQSEFSIIFRVGAVTRNVTFYPYSAQATAAQRRAMIDWGTFSLTNNVPHSLTLYSDYKTLAANRIVTAVGYRYIPIQLSVEEISFGYGADGGYAASKFVQLVIDPLNPVIPTTALGRGRTEGGYAQNFGEVQIEWSNNSIYNMKLEGGTKTVQCVVIDALGNRVPFDVNVFYLNRNPVSVYTKQSAYVDRATSDEEGYYAMMLSTQNGSITTKTFYFYIDPTAEGLYVTDSSLTTNVQYKYTVGQLVTLYNSKYYLPNAVKITFANNYAAGSVYESSLASLGEYVVLTDIKWVLSSDISLLGTRSSDLGYIKATISSFRVQYVSDGVTVTSDVYTSANMLADFGTLFDMQLTVTNRDVEYTLDADGNILSTKITIYDKDEDEEEDEEEEVDESAIDYTYQSAENYYIDPYIKNFPTTLNVKFTGTASAMTYTDIEWFFLNSDGEYSTESDYLTQSNVISGKIGAEYMYIMAYMSVFGTMLGIQFPIRARNIDVTVTTGSGESTIDPLSGGKIYILSSASGLSVRDQLPTAENPGYLYYRFDYGDGTSEIAKVPLFFSNLDIAHISNETPGTVYSGSSRLYGTLGGLDLGNIYFTVEIINPQMFSVVETTTTNIVGGIPMTSTTYSNGGFLYDYLTVAVNRAGNYTTGAETSVLPSLVVVNKNGDTMKIESIVYNVRTLKAVVTCSYTFLDYSNSPKISGDANGGSSRTVVFEIPIKTYDYTRIESTEIAFGVTSYYATAGTIVKASDLPKTVDGIEPLWVLDDVNFNLAGTYTATCYLMNAYGTLLTGQLRIVVGKIPITSEYIDAEALRAAVYNVYYTGQPIDLTNAIILGQAVRADGKTGFLRSNGVYGSIEGYSVYYSLDGGLTWITEQPLNVPEVGAANYQIRVTVNDYNYSGSFTYNMRLLKREINTASIYYGNAAGSELDYTTYLGADGETYFKIHEVTYEYNGAKQIPYIHGIPEGASYKLYYAYADANGNAISDYSLTLSPVNAGYYLMKLEFTADQRNYLITNAAFQPSVRIRITKKSVTYSLASGAVYSGAAMDAKVVGLPADLGDIVVTYTYKDANGNRLPAGSKIKNAGVYTVTVTIDGGANYPSANIQGGPTLSSLIEARYEIYPKEVNLYINTVTSEYLEPLKSFTSAITVVDASDPSLPGLQGNDNLTVLGVLNVAWTGGTLTYKHMVGSYDLALQNAITNPNYRFLNIYDGRYEITAAGAVVIGNKAELDNAIGLLQNGSTVKWYLRAGNYGDITLNVPSASIKIVGSYDLSGANEIIAVRFNSITILQGGVTLEIISMAASSKTANITIGKNAGAVTISNSAFANVSTINNTVAIETAQGYSNILELNRNSFSGYYYGINMLSGDIIATECAFNNNQYGMYIITGDVSITNCYFTSSQGSAVMIGSANALVTLSGNTFYNNNIAIESAVALRNDITLLNSFRTNSTDIRLLRP